MLEILRNTSNMIILANMPLTHDSSRANLILKDYDQIRPGLRTINNLVRIAYPSNNFVPTLKRKRLVRDKKNNFFIGR